MYRACKLFKMISMIHQVPMLHRRHQLVTILITILSSYFVYYFTYIILFCY